MQAGRDRARRRRRSASSAEGKLAHYKIPRYIQIVDEFPMTVTGKIRKVDMRKEMRQASRPPNAHAMTRGQKIGSR